MTFPRQLNITWSNAFEAFILAKRAENVSRGTEEIYQRAHEAWLRRWGDLHVAAVTPEQVRFFLLWLQGERQPEAASAPDIASATVHMYYRNLRAFFNWCEAEEILERSPMRNIKPPKVEEVIPDMLTVQEAAALLQGVRSNGDRHAFRDYIVEYMFLRTGVRLSELAGLSLDDVFLQDKCARVMGKGRKQRIVPLGDLLAVEIKRYTLKYRESGPGERALFTNEHGCRLRPRGVEALVIRDLKTYVPRTLNRYGPHTLRHTACTLLMRELKDPERVRLIMGHSDLNTTLRYLHYSADDVLGREQPRLDELLGVNGRRRDSLRERSRQPRPQGILEGTIEV